MKNLKIFVCVAVASISLNSTSAYAYKTVSYITGARVTCNNNNNASPNKSMTCKYVYSLRNEMFQFYPGYKPTMVNFSTWTTQDTYNVPGYSDGCVHGATFVRQIAKGSGFQVDSNAANNYVITTKTLPNGATTSSTRQCN